MKRQLLFGVAIASATLFLSMRQAPAGPPAKLAPRPPVGVKRRTAPVGGSVLGVGWNLYGVLGSDTAGPYRATPQPVPGITTATAISTGAEFGPHNLVLNNTGTLSYFPELFNFPYSYLPKALPKGLTNVVAISSDDYALTSDGTAWTWLYSGNTAFVPQQVTLTNGDPLTSVTGISAAAYHALFLTSSGEMYATGTNQAGEVGDGNEVRAAYAVPVLANVKACAVGGGQTQNTPDEDFSVAVTTDGTVWTWGANNLGQLANGAVDTSAHPTPFHVPGLTGVTAVAASIGYQWQSTNFAGHAVALKSDGTVWAWGANEYGQVGDGTSGNVRTAPVQVQGITDAVAIWAGDYHTLAMTADGTIWSWGGNWYGQLGLGYADVNAHSTPAPIPNLVATSAAAGEGRSLFLRGDGSVWACGYNVESELGDGLDNVAPYPVVAGGLSNIVALGTGPTHALAADSDGAVWAWGSNASGEIGAPPASVPQVELPLYWSYPIVSPTKVGGLSGIVSVAAESYANASTHLNEGTSFAVDSAGNVWAWGDNSLGQFGGAVSGNSSVPTQVPGLANVTQVAAANGVQLALESNGSLYTWATIGSEGPARMSGVPAFTSIAISGDGEAEYGIGSDGTVWAWGDDLYGRLGNGVISTYTEPETFPPAQVLGLGGAGVLNNVVGIAASTVSAFALRSDGTVWEWGADNSAPVQIPGLGNVTQITAYEALEADGTVWSWDDSLSPATQVAGIASATAISNYLTIVSAGSIDLSLTLTGYSPTGFSQLMNFVFQPNGGGTSFTRFAIVGPNGAVTLDGVPIGDYSVAVRGDRWLNRDLIASVTAGSTTSIGGSLLPGDINQDNVVDLNDFSLLASAFGTDFSSPNWNPAADLNGDGVIDLNDFSLLATDYGLEGDP